MIRGTTAQFKFKLPYEFDSLSAIKITFWQPGNDNQRLPITKVGTDCSAATDDPYSLCVSLTSEETMRFSDKYKARVQLRATHNNAVFASRQQLITVYPIHDEVLDPEIPDPDTDGWVILDGEQISG